ncbi:MAG: ATP-binding protein [Gammaproteobacteria bacterium]|nr:ATP-binding protein [Gammaproteobacteria bacterium]
MIPFLNSLRFQIVAVLLLLVMLCGLLALLALKHIAQHRDDNAALQLAGRLETAAHQLAFQGMNYKENAPRDYATYYRDVRLYYQDLMAQVRAFDTIMAGFGAGRLSPELTGLEHPVMPMLDDRGQDALERLAEVWQRYRSGLKEKLGDDPDEPRLEWASEFIIDHREELDAATTAMVSETQRVVGERLERINQANRIGLVAMVAITLVTILWFVLRVMRPLRIALRGFRQVARGDFGHQIRVGGVTELREMTDAFNRLSARLHRLFRLIDCIQQGSDLTETLLFVREEFSPLLPLDWVGALFSTRDGTGLSLDQECDRSVAPRHLRRTFPLQDPVLVRALETSETVHVDDIARAVAAEDTPSPFLDYLAGMGLGSAIILPFTDQDTLRGMLVFATRQPSAYTPAHLELLGNVGQLITHSFGKTVKLAEQTRLAAIGEFTSGIVHEVRNPLATISMALQYFQNVELPDKARKRADLAAQETRRVERLLEEILLYSKPVALHLDTIPLPAKVQDFLDTYRGLAEEKGQTFELSSEAVEIQGDWNRLTQVLLNLARNAVEAAPPGTPIRWTITRAPDSLYVALSVHNLGDPIPATNLERLTDPFFTTKPGGTGLGLGIVKRLVEAHGGELRITSNTDQGTTVTLLLPAAEPTPRLSG